ncbi:phosphomannomutase [Devosia albogilva]|uniref:Phosphomannomutase n=1 Tax=Devosia albogilva TaxID=429726 RepID=A0ABW5QMG9_9HYPH
MTSLKFGTSGLRGLVSDLQGQPARRYMAAFLRHLRETGQLEQGKVLVGRDLRPSSPAIAEDCIAAIAAEGFEPVDCGAVPTPALALEALAPGAAAVMVTGSHIPADRNGLKFYTPAGEITKQDETGIAAALDIAAVSDHHGSVANANAAALDRYRQRCISLLKPGSLAGMRIGVFEHSTVSRDLMGEVLSGLGAEIVRLGRTQEFVPVDTEAFGDAVFAPMAPWLKEHGLDVIVSADGDGDRPLMMDDTGAFVRGDVLGLLTARFLDAQAVVTPVTSNSGIERTGYFRQVVRTRVGSPYVVAGMAGLAGAVGFEANGGTFVGDGVAGLSPLPTRDALTPLIAVLGLARQQGTTVGRLVAALPLQHALADRLTDVPSDRSGEFLRRLEDEPDYAAAVFQPHGISGLSTIDGLQFRTRSGHMVHFRASGNAPELRCYVEGSTPEIASELLDWAMRTAAEAVR